MTTFNRLFGFAILSLVSCQATDTGGELTDSQRLAHDYAAVTARIEAL
jgi:hypothetical protein